MSTPIAPPPTASAAATAHPAADSSGRRAWSSLTYEPGCNGGVDEPVLVVTHDAPISQAMLASVDLRYVTLADGARLRCARWQHPDSVGTVLLMTGYSEFIEKYYEVITELYERNYSIISFDWRGQGLSTRAHARRGGWVSDYAQLTEDLLSLVQQMYEPNSTGPLIGLAHSMGGHLAIRHAQEHPETFNALLVTAPMMGLVNPPPTVLRALTQCGNWLGLGEHYIPGSTDVDPFGPHTPLCADSARIEIWRGYQRAEPYLITHGTTWRWAQEAARSMLEINQPDAKAKVRTPLLILNPLGDTLVSPAATQQYAANCPAATLVDIPTAGHELLQETNPLRERFWLEFDRFTQQTL